jgi:hypothetical protein
MMVFQGQHVVGTRLDDLADNGFLAPHRVDQDHRAV